MYCRAVCFVMCVVWWKVLCEGRDEGIGYILPQETGEDHHTADMMVSIILENLPPMSKGVLLYGTVPDSVYIRIASANIRLIVTTSIPEFTIIDEEKKLEAFKYIDKETDIGVCVFYMQSFLEISLALVDTLVHQIYDFRGTKWIVVPERGQQIQPEMIFYLFYWYNILDCVIVFLEKEGANGDILYMEYTPYVTHSLYKAARQFSCWSDKNRLAVYDGKSSGFISCNKTCLDIDHDHQADDVHFLKCIELTWRKMSDSLPMFPDKTKNLNGFPLYLLAKHTPPSLIVDESKEGIDRIQGKDANLIKVLAEKMNFTLKYRKSLDEMNANSVFDNMVRGIMELSLSKHDLSANVIYLTQYLFPPIDFIYTVEDGGLCFITHRPADLKRINHLHTLYKPSAFVPVIISFTMIVCLLQHYMKNGQLSAMDRWGKALMYTVQLVFANPVPFKGKSCKMKHLITGLSFCTIIMNYVLQAYFIYKMYVHDLHKTIDTLEDLKESGLSIEGFPSQDVILPNTSELNRVLNERFIPIKEIFSCADYLRTNSDKACWMECNIARGVYATLRDDDGKLAIHIGKEHSHSLYLAHPFPKDSPLAKTFDIYTKKVFENGLLEKWKRPKRAYKEDEIPIRKSLTLDDLIGIYLSLLLHYFVILVVFTVEVVYGRKCKK